MEKQLADWIRLKCLMVLAVLIAPLILGCGGGDGDDDSNVDRPVESGLLIFLNEQNAAMLNDLPFTFQMDSRVFKLQGIGNYILTHFNIVNGMGNFILIPGDPNDGNNLTGSVSFMSSCTYDVANSTFTTEDRPLPGDIFRFPICSVVLLSSVGVGDPAGDGTITLMLTDQEGNSISSNPVPVTVEVTNGREIFINGINTGVTAPL